MHVVLKSLIVIFSKSLSVVLIYRVYFITLLYAFVIFYFIMSLIKKNKQFYIYIYKEKKMPSCWKMFPNISPKMPFMKLTIIFIEDSHL